jgi:uncharacterized membrane protein
MARMIAKIDTKQTKSEAVKEAKHISKHLKWVKIALILSLLCNIGAIVHYLTTING